MLPDDGCPLASPSYRRARGEVIDMRPPAAIVSIGTHGS